MLMHNSCLSCGRTGRATSGVARKPKAIRCSGNREISSTWRDAGPTDPAPSYRDIDSQPVNVVVMALFRRKMVAALGSDSELYGYDAIIDLTRRLNSKFRTGAETQEATRAILNALFPSWLPGAFKVMFSKPFPEFSCRLNALATALTCQWLMGPCKVNDVEIDGGIVGKGHGVLVERCRYLEQAGCASVCINSCKIPTQTFFSKDMGLQLTMTPNYEDFSCQYAGQCLIWPHCYQYLA
ncbi:hypothetical protein Vafri_18715 [Volvox africanus]|uniref:Beta-carotene isomerase D27-like C-terminal domain-containing protein n=1 Tax=Volvox africanus TaxID=51714 RepID=A0A8J4BNS6_9CHLO|nr:hypothetical protein Vafri_18715 [Volvox africanus]